MGVFKGYRNGSLAWNLKVKLKRNLGRLVKSEYHDKTSNNMVLSIVKWDKVFKNGPSTISGRQSWRGMVCLAQRVSFTNFTWSILEYYGPNILWNSLWCTKPMTWLISSILHFADLHGTKKIKRKNKNLTGSWSLTCD